MAQLRAIYEQLGCREVTTYVESGNVILVSDDEPGELSRHAEVALAVEYGLYVRILGRTHLQLGQIVAGDPYPAAEPTQHQVVFLSEPLGPGDLAALGRAASGGESFTTINRELHLLQPNGIGQSKLGQALSERNLGVVATARNWRTVPQLHTLSRAQG
jgi:uncharacterized protein (DUF1697 family)